MKENRIKRLIIMALCCDLGLFSKRLIALSLGMVGSMGALSPIGYIVSGFVIDCVMYASTRAIMPTFKAATRQLNTKR